MFYSVRLKCLSGLSISYISLRCLFSLLFSFQPLNLLSLSVLFVPQLPLSLFLLLFHPLSPVFGLLLSKTLCLLKLLGPSDQLILGQLALVHASLDGSVYLNEIVLVHLDLLDSVLNLVSKDLQFLDHRVFFYDRYLDLLGDGLRLVIV